jgi:hypothetical protein
MSHISFDKAHRLGQDIECAQEPIFKHAIHEATSLAKLARTSQSEVFGPMILFASCFMHSRALLGYCSGIARVLLGYW